MPALAIIPVIRLASGCAKRIEESFGWTRTTGGFGRPTIVAASGCRCMLTWSRQPNNLVRIARLMSTPT
jgi:hypothetical protein